MEPGPHGARGHGLPAEKAPLRDLSPRGLLPGEGGPRALPRAQEALGERLGRIAEALAGLVEAVEAEAKQVFAEIDQWIVDAAALCQSRDPQLDLRGALPVQAATSPRKAELATA